MLQSKYYIYSSNLPKWIVGVVFVLISSSTKNKFLKKVPFERIFQDQTVDVAALKKTGLSLLLIEDMLQHEMLETVQSEWFIKKNYINKYEGRYCICEIASEIVDNMVDVRFNKKMHSKEKSLLQTKLQCLSRPLFRFIV